MAQRLEIPDSPSRRLLESTIEIHPALAVIPQLDHDELDSLVNSIREQGQLRPIVQDRHGRLLDGRGRLHACQILGIAPAFTTVTETDPSAYPTAVNLERRSLTKGQKAMIHVKATYSSGAASAWDEPPCAPTTTRTLGARAGVSAPLISSAHTVLRWAPDQVDGIIAGWVSLNDAYRMARQRKTEGETRVSRLADLRMQAPDLAARVAEEQLTLGAAEAELHERTEHQALLRRRTTDLLCALVPELAQLKGSLAFGDYDPAIAPVGREVTGEVIGAARQALVEMELVWKERGIA